MKMNIIPTGQADNSWKKICVIRAIREIRGKK